MSQVQQSNFLQRARLKNLLKKAFLLLLAIVLVYGCVAMIYATKTIYKVRKNYAVILETLHGNGLQSPRSAGIFVCRSSPDWNSKSR